MPICDALGGLGSSSSQYAETGNNCRKHWALPLGLLPPTRSRHKVSWRGLQDVGQGFVVGRLLYVASVVGVMLLAVLVGECITHSVLEQIRILCDK